MLFDYVSQRFAQVTNPPLDAIREEVVTQVSVSIGPERNLLQPTPVSCHQIKLKTAILDDESLARIRHYNEPFLRSTTLPMLFPVSQGGPGLERALESVFLAADTAIAQG